MPVLNVIVVPICNLFWLQPVCMIASIPLPYREIFQPWGASSGVTTYFAISRPIRFNGRSIFDRITIPAIQPRQVQLWLNLRLRQLATDRQTFNSPSFLFVLIEFIFFLIEFYLFNLSQSILISTVQLSCPNTFETSHSLPWRQYMYLERLRNLVPHIIYFNHRVLV